MNQINIVLSCPKCGCTEWAPKKDGEFKCYGCGKVLCPEDMNVRTRRLYRELSTGVNGGSLVASVSRDVDYPSIGICYQTEDGDLLDIAVAECKRESGNQNIDVYVFEDVYTEDYTRKFTLKKADIDEAMG